MTADPEHRGARIRWSPTWAAFVVGVVLLSACMNGRNATDDARLHDLRTDPLLQAAPPGSTTDHGIGLTPGAANGENAGGPGAELTYHLTVTTTDAARFYVQTFISQGWKQIVTTCYSPLATHPGTPRYSISAERVHNHYHEGATVNVGFGVDGLLRAQISNSAPFHTAGAGTPVDETAAPVLACLGS